jgi:hypothetical protein
MGKVDGIGCGLHTLAYIHKRYFPGIEIIMCRSLCMPPLLVCMGMMSIPHCRTSTTTDQAANSRFDDIENIFEYTHKESF